MADDFVVPVVSLDDLLVGQQRSTRDQHRRLLFPRCNSTAEERDCVERHVRRCLRCPLTPGAPSQSFRKELLAAIVEELNCCIDGDSGAPAPSSPEMESPLTGIEAARHALADVQFSIAECKSAASRVKAGNNARWWAAERSRWLSRAAELDKLAAPLRAQFAVSAAPAAATEPTSAKRTFSAGKAEKGGKLKSAATGIRRALSFDRNSKGASREELHPVARGGSKDDLHTPPTTTANGGDENGGSKSSSNRAARSLSFERFRKKLGSAKKEKPAEAATPSEPASENKKKSKAAMLRAAARFATGIKKPDKGSEEPPPSSPNGSEASSSSASLSLSTAQLGRGTSMRRLDFGSGRTASAAALPLPTSPNQEPPFEADLKRACRLHEVLLFALVAAWQRRAIDAHTGGGAVMLSSDVPTPFPVELDGSLLLRGGVSGWLLDEFAARCALSPLCRALGVLSVAVEGAMQADGGGEGAGASPDLLRLGCDALAQTLIAMQAEETLAAPAAGLASQTMMSYNQQHVQPKVIHHAPAAADEQHHGKKAKKATPTRARRAALALATSLPNSRSSKKLVDSVRKSIRESLTGMQQGGGGGLGDLDEDAELSEDEEDGHVCVGKIELATYARCATGLWSYISARLPALIAERDEAAEYEGDSYGDGGEENACAELLVHLLSLSHRLAPVEDNDVFGSMRESSFGAEDDLGHHYGGLGSPHHHDHHDRFMWSVELCPDALASASKAALRSAVTLICEQEMRAALQTRRATANAANPPLVSVEGSKQNSKKAQQQQSDRMRSTAATEADMFEDAWVQMVRLRRLRERLQRALPMHLQLLSAVAGGGQAVLRVWAEAMWVAVIEPLSMLFGNTPTGSTMTLDVLGLSLEHRRVAVVFGLSKRDQIASQNSNGGPGMLERGESSFLGAPDSALFAKDEGWRNSVAEEMSKTIRFDEDELAGLRERAWYSPFVFDWIGRASKGISAWHEVSLAEETWAPTGPERHSRTLIMLYALCHTFVRALRRLRVHSRGEAVNAAQAIADHYEQFATELAVVAKEELSGARGHTVSMSKEAGAPVGIQLQNGAGAKVKNSGHLPVLIAAIEGDSVLASRVSVGEVLISVDGVAVDDAKKVAATLRTASHARLRLLPPATGADAGERAARKAQWREMRAAAKLVEARTLLTLLRVEKTIPVDDPLGKPGADDLENGGGNANGDESSGALIDEVFGEADGDEAKTSPIDAVSTATTLEDEAIRSIVLGDASANGLEESSGDDGDGGIFASGGPQWRWRCLLASNAWTARRHLEDLASSLEDSLAGSTSAEEQRAIISQGFQPVFSVLRTTADDHITALLGCALAPLNKHVENMSPQFAPANGGKRQGPTALLDTLAVEYSAGLKWLRRSLGVDVLQRLLQRVWTGLIATLITALGQHLFMPRDLGNAFAERAIQLLTTLGPILRGESGDGPSNAWLKRRAAPLQSTLELCTDATTAALLQQCRIQPVGPRRTAVLVALALRMDDRDAAELIATSEPSELMAGGEPGEDEQALAVDGTAALEAVRRPRSSSSNGAPPPPPPSNTNPFELT